MRAQYKEYTNRDQWVSKYGITMLYAFKIDNGSFDPEFYKKVLGQQLESLKILKQFKEESKILYVNQKRAKITLSKIKSIIKEYNIDQFYCEFRKADDYHQDDSIEIYYK